MRNPRIKIRFLLLAALLYIAFDALYRCILDALLADMVHLRWTAWVKRERGRVAA